MKGIAAQIEAAARDPASACVRVSRSQLSGGEVAGRPFYLGDRIPRALRPERQAGLGPLFCRSTLPRAGNALASQGRTVSCFPRTGAVGSIGVVVMTCRNSAAARSGPACRR